ncbi:MAG: asparagine synthase (glutamine-hydrolyzing), partial [Planctomycetaceae bacterium]
MCGFVGSFNPRAGIGADELNVRGTRMAEAIQHRGPDDHGVWCDETSGIMLAHRRLAIIDLSPAGHQPMVSRCGWFQLVYNGEIYNFESVREELGAEASFRGRSDTEVLVEAIARWGLDATLSKLNGMFGFALWDQKERTVSLVRDRMGIKPVYYGVCGRTLLFGSELKALRQHPDFDASINRTAIGELLQHSYIPTSRSIYEGVFKLPPAHVLTVRADDLGQTLRPRRYWSIPFDADASEDWETQFEVTLTDAVGSRMLADVPLGAFLSGGIDSSTVVALMQSLSDRPVKTFTIGFEEAEWNEAPHAARIAKHLGTDHTEFFVTADEARNVIPDLPAIYDEPFADVSQIPTFLVSKLARQHVTVCLSGDGGDELFGGYDRYHHIRGINDKRKKVPNFARGPLAALITHPLLQKLRGNAPRESSLWRGVLKAADIRELYLFLHRHWREPEQLVVGYHVDDVVGFRQNAEFEPNSVGGLFTMMAIDHEAYFPDDILVKVDRASMRVGLEARVPLLDHRVVEHAWRMEPNRRFAGAKQKQALRNVLKKYVPLEMFDRPKAGFGVPIDSWLRGPLRDWAEALLSEERLKREGYLSPAPIR